jgi:hypothetical protein
MSDCCRSLSLPPPQPRHGCRSCGCCPKRVTFFDHKSWEPSLGTCSIFSAILRKSVPSWYHRVSRQFWPGLVSSPFPIEYARGPCQRANIPRGADLTGLANGTARLNGAGGLSYRVTSFNLRGLVCICFSGVVSRRIPSSCIHHGSVTDSSEKRAGPDR